MAGSADSDSTVASLGAKLDALELTDAETALLWELLGVDDEVSGFVTPSYTNLLGSLLPTTRICTTADGSPVGLRASDGPVTSRICTTADGAPQT